MTDTIPDTPPEDEEGRAVWSIRRLFKAITGQEMSEAEGRTLYAKARERLTSAMAEAAPPTPSTPGKSTDG